MNSFRNPAKSVFLAVRKSDSVYRLSPLGERSWPGKSPVLPRRTPRETQILAFSPFQEICINKPIHMNNVAITKIFEG